jgi:hypothetical protein
MAEARRYEALSLQVEVALLPRHRFTWCLRCRGLPGQRYVLPHRR